MQCFHIRMYSKKTLPEGSKCPAVCKLRDSDAEDDLSCAFHEKYLMVPDGRENAHSVSMRSPRQPCGLPYRQEEVCLYNVSLACATDHVIISRDTSDPSSLSLAEKDFLEVIDFTHKRHYDQIKGRDSLQENLHVYASQFVLLFWSIVTKQAKMGSKFTWSAE